MSEHLRVRMITAGLLGLVFAAGLVTGVAADRTLSSAEALASAEADEAEAGPRHGEWMIDRVDLTSEQRIQVDSLVQYHRDRMGDLTTECQGRYWTVVRETRDEIRALLSEGQRAHYDSLLAERDRRRAAEARGEGS